MTSSTSSSDSVEPRWGRIWAVAIIIVLIVTGAWELLARHAGIGPALVDNKTLWADTRHQLNQHGEEAIVLIGGSRIQRGVDVDRIAHSVEVRVPQPREFGALQYVDLVSDDLEPKALEQTFTEQIENRVGGVLGGQLLGGFAGVLLVLAQIEVAHRHAGAHRTHAFGMVFLCSSLAYVVGPVVGGHLADESRYPWA